MFISKLQDKVKVNKKSGFTLIELLIVIVVIGILASITIVSYAAITKGTKTANAQQNALSVQKIANAFFADFQVYPSSTNDFSAPSITKLSQNITVLLDGTGLDSSNGETAILYQYKGPAGRASGGSIQYYDFGSDTLSTPIYVGDATSLTGLTQPSS